MKYHFTSVALLGAIMATVGRAEHHDHEECCTVYSKRDYNGTSVTYCLDHVDQDAFHIAFLRDRMDSASIKCGKKVDALICPDTFDLGPVPNQRQHRFTCLSDTDEVEHGFKVAAN